MEAQSIPTIRKILYCTDMSKNADYAFAYAVSLASRYDAKITVFHVVEDLSPTRDRLVMNMLGDDKWQELREANRQKVLASLQGELEAFCDRASREIPACPLFTQEVMVRIGNPTEEILKEARKGGHDLVLMGARGHGAFAEAMMGSVSRRVLRRCHTPVLVVRLPEA